MRRFNFSIIKKLKRVAYYLFLISLRRGVLFLPRKLSLRLGVVLADLAFLILKRDKLSAMDNLEACHGQQNGRKRLRKIAKESFRNLGKSAVELMQFPKLTSLELVKLVHIEGEEKLKRALDMGRGVIMLTAHLGNWELLGAILAERGYKINAIVSELKNPKLNQLIDWQRRLMNVNPIPRSSSVKTTLAKLKRNEIVAILADLDTKVNGVFVDFFGRQAYTAKGPAAIAKRTLSPIVPMFIIRQPDNSHKIIIEEPMAVCGDVQVDTERLTKIIESYVRNYPEQWIWLHQRWKTQKKLPTLPTSPTLPTFEKNEFK